MNGFQTTREDIGSCRRRLLGALAVGTVMLGANAFGQSMRFRPIRSAPLGSPVGTFGEPVTSQFNDELGCWEVFVPAGSEVDLAIEATGWELAPGAPNLCAIQAQVVSTGYSNGIGGDLNPKGWPTSPQDGAYQAKNWCDPQFGGNGAPCNSGGFGPCAAGICVHNPDWIMPPCANDLPAIATNTLDFAWATSAQYDCYSPSGGLFPTLGGLILEVPNNAAGTYVIALNPSPDFSFMGACSGAPIPGVTFTPACITITDSNLAPPIRAPAPHHILKNRYISIDPRGAGQTNPPSHHIRVTVASSEVNGQVGNGPWWANAPFNTNAASCISLVTATKPAVEPDWTDCNIAHLTGCPIIPTTTYALAAEAVGMLSAEALFDTQARPGVKWFGDIIGGFDGEEWLGPDGVVNIDDAFAAIKTFQNPTATPGCDNPPCNATHVSVSDVHPHQISESPNQIVNINDVFEILKGFRGFEFPGTDLTQCP